MIKIKNNFYIVHYVILYYQTIQDIRVNNMKVNYLFYISDKKNVI